MRNMFALYLRRPVDGVRFSWTGVTGSCELPDVGAKNQTQVLCHRSKCSYPLNHLSSISHCPIPGSSAVPPTWKTQSNQTRMECWGDRKGLIHLWGAEAFAFWLPGWLAAHLITTGSHIATGTHSVKLMRYCWASVIRMSGVSTGFFF